jgi:hypothetical protein
MESRGPAQNVSVLMLDVPPMPRVVPASVFDAWSWCESDTIEWRRPEGAESFSTEHRTINSENPAGLAFVMREECSFLPRELACLHAFGYGLVDEFALAPWAIDDATDLLYENRLRPRDVFWLAANTLEALVWGLHDWAHFHNHGPFEEQAMTELQCDLLALAWLRGNAERIGIGERRLDAVARDLAALSRFRFSTENLPSPVTSLEALFAGPYPRSLG